MLCLLAQQGSQTLFAHSALGADLMAWSLLATVTRLTVARAQAEERQLETISARLMGDAAEEGDLAFGGEVSLDAQVRRRLPSELVPLHACNLCIGRQQLWQSCIRIAAAGVSAQQPQVHTRAGQ